MKRSAVEKFLDRKVAVTFDADWFNEAVQSWVFGYEEYEGTLRLNECYPKAMYELECERPSPTDRACFGVTHIKKVRELK